MHTCKFPDMLFFIDINPQEASISAGLEDVESNKFAVLPSSSPLVKLNFR
jgi:hypothetical protein